MSNNNGNNNGNHALGAGLALGAVAESNAAYKSGQHALKLYLPKVSAGSARKLISRPEGGKAALGSMLLQTTNLGIGAMAAKKLLTNGKPKQTGTVMKNDMSMISKSVGYNRTSGHGVNLAKSDDDSKLLNRMHELKEMLDKPTRLTRGEAVLGTAGVLGGGSAIHMARKKKKVVSKGLRDLEVLAKYIEDVEKADDKKRSNAGGSLAVAGGLTQAGYGARQYYVANEPDPNPKIKRHKYRHPDNHRLGIRGKNNIKLGAGAAALGAAGLAYDRKHNSKVEKGYLVSKGIPSVAKPLLDQAGRYTTKVSEANSELSRVAKKPYGGKMGFIRAAVASSGKQAERVSGAERSHLIRTGRQDKADLKRVLGAYRPTGSLSAIGKAYRRFDPEADRQRRIGQYQGLGLGTSVVTGSMAGKHFTTHVKVSGKNARGIAAKPGSGRKGAALAAVSAVSAAGGLGAFKRGISERNQPWT